MFCNAKKTGKGGKEISIRKGRKEDGNKGQENINGRTERISSQQQKSSLTESNPVDSSGPQRDSIVAMDLH